MALTSGTRLGPYEVLSPLGAGGMGEVYRARDVRLSRDVALKVLPSAFAAETERMARFEREAKLLASLNHPNIASIYGLEESNLVRALVMELVEGPTLAERIVCGPIPVDEALPIAQQICEGLEYAHERGIVHRDLKPANVSVTSQGQAKILDFGLAKALDADATAGDPANSPTLTRGTAHDGIMLGTAAYMSPEQARGSAADRRADIWAFGILLYEMLSGKPAFDGKTVSETLAGVMRDEPDWSALPAAVPDGIRRLLTRCLCKDPKRRLQAIGDARIAIEEVRGGTDDQQALASTRPAPEARRAGSWTRIIPWAAAAALAIALLAEVKLLPTQPGGTGLALRGESRERGRHFAGRDPGRLRRHPGKPCERKRRRPGRASRRELSTRRERTWAAGPDSVAGDPGWHLAVLFSRRTLDRFLLWRSAREGSV